MNKINHLKSSFKKILKKIFLMREYRPIVNLDNKFQKRRIFNVIGGNLNPDKIFYVIQRYPGYGIFSNLTFVINHMKIALDMGFIPIVDMQNYSTIYNENKKIYNTFNSWEYYYEQLSPYSLEDVYNSKNIILTDNKFYSELDFSYNINEKEELIEIFHKFIKVKKIKLKLINYLKNKLFKGHKILGVHFRGTGYKLARNPYPATINQMINIITKILKEENYDKIFLMTEDQTNFEKLVEYFGDKIIYLNTTVRGRTNQEVYDNYSRDRHRYKLGRDVLVETYLLSYCDGYFDIDTNPRTIAHVLNLNPKQKRYTIDNGFNHSWPIFNYLKYSWHLKNLLPEKFGGFKNNKKPLKKFWSE